MSQCTTDFCLKWTSNWTKWHIRRRQRAAPDMFLKRTSRGPSVSLEASLVSWTVSVDVVHHWQLMGCGLSASSRSHFLLCSQQLVSTVIYTAELWYRGLTQNVGCSARVCVCVYCMSLHTHSLSALSSVLSLADLWQEVIRVAAYTSTNRTWLCVEEVAGRGQGSKWEETVDWQHLAGACLLFVWPEVCPVIRPQPWKG